MHRAEENLTNIIYRDDNVHHFVLPTLQATGQDAVLQGINARPHIASSTGIMSPRRSWPALSPAINPIKYL